MGAQAPAPQLDSMAAGLRMLYSQVRGNLLQSAQLMPEANYAFKPTPDVRTFAELIGHVVNAQYNFCAPVVGGKPPAVKNYELVTTKDDLVDALKDAFTYCDAAYDAATETTLSDPATFSGTPVTKLYLLTYNIAHDNEHYGNVVTYLRLKGLVPPSTARSKVQ